jgi:hypothetical protein
MGEPKRGKRRREGGKLVTDPTVRTLVTDPKPWDIKEEPPREVEMIQTRTD